MSVKKEANGRRSVQVEVEVPGTPEEVWQAIATGPGVSSWFVPTSIDGRAGGKIVSNFGAGGDAEATITGWEAPHRMTAESRNLPNAPLMATEWTVEARDGGNCVVRVVHSLFAETDDWDDQLSGTEHGWPVFFRILKLYLTRFRSQPCSSFIAGCMAPVGAAQAYETLSTPLGFAGASVGQRAAASADAPPFAGEVEGIREGQYPYAFILLDQPTPGVAVLSICGMGEQSFNALSFYLYGEQAAEAAARDQSKWQEWMGNRFPAATAACS